MAYSGNIGVLKILFDFSIILSLLIKLVCLSSYQEKKRQKRRNCHYDIVDGLLVCGIGSIVEPEPEP
jgi:hypothetical protein